MIVIRKEIPNTGNLQEQLLNDFFRIAEIYRHILANEVRKQTDKRSILPRIISGNYTDVKR